MRDQQALIDAIGQHISTLGALAQWALLVIVVFFWAGLNQAPQIDVLGIKIEKDKAWFAANILYVAANLYAFDLILKLGNYLKEIDDTHLSAALTKVVTNPSFANPFAGFGLKGLSQIYASKGFGVLILLWWLANSSLYTFGGKSLTQELVAQGLFFTIGIASMLGIFRVNSTIVGRVGKTGSDSARSFKIAGVWSSLFAGLGAAIGFYVATYANCSAIAVLKKSNELCDLVSPSFSLLGLPLSR